MKLTKTATDRINELEGFKTTALSITPQDETTEQIAVGYQAEIDRILLLFNDEK